ncbi:prion protein interacting protein [Ahrensia sp. R2A130]|nr:prion protein interacting protein [Ahrensia sp. R2A130]
MWFGFDLRRGSSGCNQLLPLTQSNIAVRFEMMATGEMTSLIEVVVDEGVN